jgi:hypothetical protein
MTIARSSIAQPSATRDVALVYASRWESPETAERFARFYAGAVAKRYSSAKVVADWQKSTKPTDPVLSTEILTEEGPVIVEQLPGNIVFVSESFDPVASVRVREAVLRATASAQATAISSRDNIPADRETHASDLCLRLASWPEFASLRNAIHASAIEALAEAARSAAAQQP